jgi:dimethylamine/trimethylamine dehydrogenase
MPNVDLYPGGKLLADDIAEFGAQRVVLATGAVWRRDGVGSTHLVPIDGLASMTVFTPDDLSGELAPGPVILVYDDDHDYMGSVVAEHFARNGHQVVFATPLAELSAWTDQKLERDRIVQRLHQLGVDMHTQTTVERVEAGVVHVVQGPGAVPQRIECDALMLVSSREPAGVLHQQLIERGLDESRIHVIGDGLAPGTLQAAVYSGHAASMALITGHDHTHFRRDRATLEV